ncbi:MAG: type 1 glutamine amidotransferase-like domain-containing protein [Anaerolineae bacterium]|nr:type 1 glutamine amidotransferase-like domain-containing protein [Anaerolineae bacterium]
MNLNINLKLPTRGTLALVGSGEYLPDMEAVDRRLLGRLAQPARVICLPTAAGTEGDERIQYWSNLGIAHFTRLGVSSVEALRVIDHASANDANLANRILESNFVYLSGGKPDYLCECLEGSAVWEALCSVLEKGGVLAGCSAGAMIFGSRVPRLKFPWRTRPAFNFLPNTFIIPHFNEFPPRLLFLFKMLAGRRLVIGIDGFTALVCSQGGVWVDGKGGVTLRNRRCQARFTSANGAINHEATGERIKGNKDFALY